MLIHANQNIEGHSPKMLSGRLQQASSVKNLHVEKDPFHNCPAGASRQRNLHGVTKR